MRSEDNRNVGTHIIGHADSNNDIAQNPPPSIPYLRGDRSCQIPDEASIESLDEEYTLVG